MRVAVVYFGMSNSSPIIALAKALAEGIGAQGHQIELVDGMTERDKKMTIYQYIAVGTEQRSFFGKIHERITHFLASQGTVQGKRCFAFVSKKIAGTDRALLRLMSAMEKEGMLIRNSGILLNPEHAVEVGKHLHIDN